MQYLGRIITNSKNVESLDYVEITDDISKIDKSIPTLIIGRKLAESIYTKEKVHLLDKKIEENIYWTFGKLEKRTEFEKDINEFNNLILKNLLDSVDYVYFSIFTKSLSCIKRFITYINNDIDKIFYINDKHLYLLCKKTVVGISLVDTEYIGVSSEKIINKIKLNSHNKILYNDYFISNKMRKLLNNNKIIVPYLYFLEKM